MRGDERQTDGGTDGLSGMKTQVIRCSTGPHSWHTYRLGLSQFATGDEGDPLLPVQPSQVVDGDRGLHTARIRFGPPWALVAPLIDWPEIDDALTPTRGTASKPRIPP